MSYLSELLGTSYKEGMTEEDISNALEKLNKNSTSEADKLKIQLSRANSEAAEYKKQLRAKQTDDEAAAAETKAAIEKLMAENAELKKSMDIATKTAKLTAQGFSEELAKATATAMLDGDFDTVLTNQAKYLEEQRQAIKKDLMNGTPKPAVGSSSDVSIDLNKKIEEAKQAHDYGMQAYYMRLQQEQARSGLADDVK